MILSKTKKISLLALLVLVSFVLSAVKFVSGGKTSKARADVPDTWSYCASCSCSGAS